MKKLNRKGFTLVELLAVIIILAIVIGISIPAVLSAVENARKKSFDNAVDSIKSYIKNQVDLSSLPSDLRGADYVDAIGTCTSGCSKTTGSILTVTGYSDNIDEIKWTVTNGNVTITCATPTNNGDYKQGTKYSTAC